MPKGVVALSAFAINDGGLTVIVTVPFEQYVVLPVAHILYIKVYVPTGTVAETLTAPVVAFKVIPAFVELTKDKVVLDDVATAPL